MLIVKNKTGEVSSCDILFDDNIADFNTEYLKYTSEVTSTCQDRDLSENSMFIGTSAIIDTEIDGAVGMNSGIFNNPFIIWGRYRKKFFRYYLTLSFQFHHTQMDGEYYASTYRRLFHDFNTEGAVELYPDVLETLIELKKRGIILTIASSRSKASLTKYVRTLGLESIISFVLGADDVKDGKPAPEAVNRTLEKFGFLPEEALVVGDTTFDIQMGKAAGTWTCGVTYGNGSKESLADADRIIDDFRELLR